MLDDRYLQVSQNTRFQGCNALHNRLAVVHQRSDRFMEDVKFVCGVKYLCTRKLSQDPLENCLSFIRAKCGFSANPDPKQFADAYKQVLVKSCIS